MYTKMDIYRPMFYSFLMVLPKNYVGVVRKVVKWDLIM